MALEIKVTKDAAAFLESRDRKTKEAIKKHLTKLSVDPLSYPLSKPLRKRSERCCRVGDYRILFTVEDTVLLVAIIGHRKNVYE